MVGGRGVSPSQVLSVELFGFLAVIMGWVTYLVRRRRR